MIKTKKYQGGIEFLIISGAVLFFFVIFFVAIQTSTEERNREKELILIKNLALSIQDEINLAAESSDGYVRSFYIPEQISNKNYEVKIVGNIIYIKTDKDAVSLTIGQVTGDIRKGTNTIRRENGMVYLNQ